MKRRAAVAAAEGTPMLCHLAPLETVLFAKLPNVMSHLCVMRYDDGASRRPGRMFIETSGPFFKVVLKEPDDDLEMVLSGPTIDDTLALADLMLGAEKAPWVTDQFAVDRRSGRRKK